MARPRRRRAMTHSRPAVRELLTSRGLAPRRDLGQNFVADPNTVRRIAHLAGVGPGDRVVEIGAGLGSLTLALAETGAAVTAVEVDHGLVGALRDVVGRRAERSRVVEADAMTLDWDEPARRPRPAGCSSPTCRTTSPRRSSCDLLDGVPAIARMLVMVQREVAERLAAAAGLAGLRRGQRQGRLLGDGPHRRRRAGVGVRAPARTSSRRSSRSSAARRPTSPRTPLFALVRTAFGQRRKMLRRSLAGVVDAGAVRRRRRRPDGPARGARRSTTGCRLARRRSARP